MRKTVVVILIILAVLLLLGHKEKTKPNKPKLSEKDLLKIHISTKRSK